MNFLADVSHELRKPLTMIRINAEVGLGIERDCTHTRLLKEIAKGSARMSRLIDDLLFLARSDSDSPPLELKPVAVPPFLAEVAKRTEAVARGWGATFEARLTGEGWLRIDPTRIEQAVLILMDNAAKYSPPGSLVTLATTTEEDELCISVQDTGPGIAEVDLPHIFERFYRGKKMRTDDCSHGGTGLGLAIAKVIAEAHSGRIEAASQVGEGTRMSLYLPLTSTSHPANQETATSNGETRPESVFS
jgi:signal transduction histidine kinase